MEARTSAKCPAYVDCDISSFFEACAMERQTFKRVTGIRLWPVGREVTPSPRENDKILTNHGEHAFITSFLLHYPAVSSMIMRNLRNNKRYGNYRPGASEVYTSSILKIYIFFFFPPSLDVSLSTCSVCLFFYSS